MPIPPFLFFSAATSWRRFLLTRAAMLLLLLAPAGAAGDEPGRFRFEIPRMDADVSLRLFSEQADQEIIYAPDAVRGVRTNLVRGTFSPTDALARMLAGTVLTTIRAKNGAVAVCRKAQSPLPAAKP